MHKIVWVRFVIFLFFVIEAGTRSVSAQAAPQCYLPAVCSSGSKSYTTWMLPDGGKCTGSQGLLGPKGEKGSIGIRGVKGDIGPQGIPATSGQAAVTGDVGAPGPVGAKGATGATGDPGATGVAAKPNAKLRTALNKLKSDKTTLQQTANRLNASITRNRQNLSATIAQYKVQNDARYTAASQTFNQSRNVGPFCSLGASRGGSLSDASFTSSSDFNVYHSAINARLHNQIAGSRTGAWSSKALDVNQWIQVDLGTVKQVAGIMLQGRPTNYNQWVTSFALSCGVTKSNLTKILNPGTSAELVFRGNVDMKNVVTNLLPKVVRCRYVRLLPRSWNGHISLRLDYLGLC